MCESVINITMDRMNKNKTKNGKRRTRNRRHKLANINSLRKRRSKQNQISSIRNVKNNYFLPVYEDVIPNSSALQVDTLIDIDDVGANNNDANSEISSIEIIDNNTNINRDNNTDDAICLESSDNEDNSVIYIGENKNVNTNTKKKKSLTVRRRRRRKNKENSNNNISSNNNKSNKNNHKEEAPNIKKRLIIIDGSNVAFAHSLHQYFSVEGLAICIKYFKDRNFDVKAVVPQYRLSNNESSNPALLQKLFSEGYIVWSPCRVVKSKVFVSHDDKVILKLAHETNAAVVSNDYYKDLMNVPEYKEIISKRVLSYTWLHDIFMLPDDPYGRNGPSLSTILYTK